MNSNLKTVATNHINASVLHRFGELEKAFHEWQKSPPVSPNSLIGFPPLPPYLSARVCGWISAGANFQVMQSALKSLGAKIIPASPEWIQAFETIGDTYSAHAEKAEREGELATACQAFIDAANYYYIARWPHLLSEASALVYAKSLKSFERAAAYFSCFFDVLKIPFNNSYIQAHLYLPTQKVNTTKDMLFPIAIVSGGMDSWKCDLEVQTIISSLLAARVAVCAIDMPGTGQSPIPLSTDGHVLFQTLITFLQQHPFINKEAIGFYGLSFGGHWAVKSALIFPEIKAAVNVGGPVHLTFQPENTQKFEKGTKATLARCLGKSLDTFSLEDLKNLSLLNQGFISSTKSPAPILSINGSKDELVPIEEIDFLSQSGILQDKLIYALDRHVASFHQKEHLPYGANWLRNHLM